MERETRSDRMYNELDKFLKDSSQTKRSLTLYKREADRLKKYLYEQDISVEVSSERELSKGKLIVTLKKL